MTPITQTCLLSIDTQRCNAIFWLSDLLSGSHQHPSVDWIPHAAHMLESSTSHSLLPPQAYDAVLWLTTSILIPQPDP
jgi:hypothetical protein